jgi:uncharacterized protein (DUF2062 family)
MKKWFKKYIPTAKSMEKNHDLKKAKSFFKADCYWSRDIQPVARGVAAGLAAAVIPGFQFFYAAILVILLRGNLPIALLSTLITNPLTFLPITYSVYYVGRLIIKNGNTPFVVREFRWNFSSFHAFWANVSAYALQFGKAFLVGLPIVSLCLGLIGYFGTILVWKGYVYYFNKKKK